MKLTVITHVWNEAFLLPYWLRHHSEMFDHGVVIDYGSTDGTPDLARQLAPNWEVRRSRNAMFDAALADAEVMDVEREFDGWKIALNVTEFIYHDDLRGFARWMVRYRPEVLGVWAKDVVMVDRPQDADAPLTDEPLFAQKRFGYPGNGARSRLLHRCQDGCYEVGRHASGVVAKMPDEEIMVSWFGWCPIKFVWERKLAIQKRIPETDKQLGRGWQHAVSEDTLRTMYDAEVAKSFDLLLGCPSYARMIERLMRRVVVSRADVARQPMSVRPDVGHERAIAPPPSGEALDVSVVITACNAAPFIARTLRSVLRQSPPPREVIVVDDASTDDTQSAVRSLAVASPVPVRVLSTDQRSGGPARPLNVGIEAAASTHIATLDHDDVMLKGKLARQLKCISDCPGAGLVVSRERIEGRLWGGERNPRVHEAWTRMRQTPLGSGYYRVARTVAYEALIENGCFWGSMSNLLFPRSIWESTGAFDERLRLYVDFAFVQGVARSHDVAFVDDVLVERHLRSDGHYRNASDLRKSVERLCLLWRFDWRRLTGTGRKRFRKCLRAQAQETAVQLCRCAPPLWRVWR